MRWPKSSLKIVFLSPFEGQRRESISLLSRPQIKRHFINVYLQTFHSTLFSDPEEFWILTKELSRNIFLHDKGHNELGSFQNNPITIIPFRHQHVWQEDLRSLLLRPNAGIWGGEHHRSRHSRYFWCKYPEACFCPVTLCMKSSQVHLSGTDSTSNAKVLLFLIRWT